MEILDTRVQIALIRRMTQKMTQTRKVKDLTEDACAVEDRVTNMQTVGILRKNKRDRKLNAKMQTALQKPNPRKL